MPILAALDAWGIEYFFEDAIPGATQISQQAAAAVNSHDILVRVCTASTPVAANVQQETNTFRALQAEATRLGHGDQRVFINVVLDPNYRREPFDAPTLYVDATNRPRSAWIADLGRALGAHAVPTGLSRRAILGLGAAAVTTVASASAAGALFLDYHTRTTAPKYQSGASIWNATIGETFMPFPIAQNGAAYVGSVAGPAAFDIATGQTIWANKVLVPKRDFSSPSVWGSLVYVEVDGTLHALSSQNGEERWSHAFTRNVIAWSQVVSGEFVTFEDDGTLTVFDAAKGSIHWRKQLVPPPPLRDYSSSSGLFSLTPLLVQGMILIGTPDHRLVAFDAQNGTKRWEYLARGPIYSTPAVDNGVVYFGAHDGAVYAVDFQHGTLRWRYQTNGVISSSVLARDGIVFCGSNDAYVYALDGENGRPFWRTKPATTATADLPFPPSGNMVIAGTSLYLRANMSIYAFRVKDGVQIWQVRTDAKSSLSDPTIDGGVLVYGTDSAHLFAVGA